MSLLLVDMDGVDVDWGAGWDKALDAIGPDAANIPRHKDQQSFDLKRGLNRTEKQIVDHVMKHMRYIELTAIPGAIKALRSMVEYGHDVFLCTSPWLPNKFCAQDKLDWVEQRLGTEWAARVIITKDKTMVRGDYLIDDKPDITGRFEPTWTQIMFTQPYNVDVQAQFRLNSWADWKNEEW